MQAVETSQGIGSDSGIGAAHVGCCIHVVERSGDGEVVMFAGGGPVMVVSASEGGCMKVCKLGHAMTLRRCCGAEDA